MKNSAAEITELSKDPNLMETLLRSFAPRIYGYNEAKEAIILQMFGGGYTAKPTTREEIHILIVGDPSVSKACLLEAARKTAPISATIYGSMSSAAIETARDGLLIVDELDRMPPKDHKAMELVMEHAPVSVLAAAEPKDGRIDSYKTLAEQFNIPPSMIGKFDLIFPIRDILDSETDRITADRIIAHRAGKTKDECAAPEINEGLLRAYIAHARGNANPTLKHGTPAADAIIEYYAALRARGKDGAMAATPRQLETLIRISEASAKTRLSDEVNTNDVERATRLFEFVIREIAADIDSGELDIDRIVSAHPHSKRKTIEKLIGAYEEASPDNMAPLKDIIDAAESEGICRPEAEGIIEELRQKGAIYEAKHRHYRLTEGKQ